jgi:hypothetical protein
MPDRYIVATDGPAHSRFTPAKLYKLTGHHNRAELAGSGTLEQIQVLADELNGGGQ